MIGRVFDEAAVTELSPEAERGAVPSHLATLGRKELLEPIDGPSHGGTFQFRHVLIRDAAYASLPRRNAPTSTSDCRAGSKVRRRSARRGRGDRRVSPRGSPSLSGRAGDARRARRRDRRSRGPAPGLSSRKGRRPSDTRAAANLLSRATALLRPNDPDRGPLLVDLGLALRDMGEVDRADAVLAEVMARAEASGDELMHAHAVVQRWLGYDGTQAGWRRRSGTPEKPWPFRDR